MAARKKENTQRGALAPNGYRHLSSGTPTKTSAKHSGKSAVSDLVASNAVGGNTRVAISLLQGIEHRGLHFITAGLASREKIGGERIQHELVKVFWHILVIQNAFYAWEAGPSKTAQVPQALAVVLGMW